MKGLIFLLLALSWAFATFAQQKAASPKSKTDLHTNRLRVYEIVPGEIVWPKSASGGTSPEYARPPVAVDFDGSPKPSAGISAAGLWLGGLDTAGQVRVSCASARNNKFPFVAGPLSGDWLTDSLNAIRWDCFFKADRWELEAHRADWADNGVLDNPLPNVVGWPGRGNPHFENQHGFPLPGGEFAPFVDTNGDSIYNAYDGDYPHPPSLAPDILPGEIVWNVFNDAYGDFLGVPLGVEVQSTAWALACNGDNLLNETVFFSYRITNRSGMDLDSVVAAMYMSRHHGNTSDDAWGTFLPGQSVFIYNTDNLDSLLFQSNDPTYFFGQNPPTFSFTSLNKNLTNSIYFISGGTCDPFGAMSSPGAPLGYFRYLNGHWNDGTPLTYGGDGYSSDSNSIPADFAFPDDPNNQAGWSTMYINSPSWGSCIKIIPSIKIGKLPNNTAATIETAFSYHRGPDLNHLQNVSYCYDRVLQLRQFYDAKFAGACTYPQSCTDDCVWPGDFDRDGIVSLRDLLPLGTGWGAAGPEREGPVTWAPHTATDWDISFNNTYDFKHLDANGDGTTDSLDLKVMQIFQGLSIPGYVAPADTYVVGDGLWLMQVNTNANPDNIQPNNYITVRVRVGDAPDLYGVEFEAEFDTAYWKLYNVGSSPISPGIRMFRQKVGGIELAAVFTDTAYNFNANQLLLAGVLYAKAIPDSLPDTTFIRIKNIRGIRADGSEIPMSANYLRYCFGGGCPAYVGMQEVRMEHITVYPNPSSGRLILTAPGMTWEQIEAFDMAGRLLRRWKEPGSEQIELDLIGISAGWVLLQVKNHHWVEQRKVLLLR